MKKEEMIKKYFFKIGNFEREKVKEWHEEIMKEKRTDKQNYFITIVDIALQMINYSYEIATIEPSAGEYGVYYKTGDEIVGKEQKWSYSTWRDKAKNFVPEYNSRLANLYELFLWYAYRIAMNYWTIEEVCDDSSMLGNYYWADRSSKKVENSSERACGGFSDGIGNTYRLVTLENGFCLVGGSCFDGPFLLNVSHVQYDSNDENCSKRTSGVIVLRK